MLSTFALQLVMMVAFSSTPSDLNWRSCFLGQGWVNNSCVGEPTLLQWNQAKLAARELNQVAWRLPTLDELQGILRKEARNRPVLTQVTDEWLLTSSIMRHGDELLVAALHLPSQKVEYRSVRDSGLVLLVHD